MLARVFSSSRKDLRGHSVKDGTGDEDRHLRLERHRQASTTRCRVAPFLYGNGVTSSTLSVGEFWLQMMTTLKR